MKAQLAIVLALAGFLLIFSPIVAQEADLNIEWTKVLDREIDSLAVSPDGNRMAFSSRETSTIAVIDWQRGESIWEVREDLGRDRGVEAQVAWSPNDHYIARIGSDGSLAIYSAPDGTRLEQIEAILNNVRIALTETSSGELDSFTDLQWNADGTQLAVMVRSYIVVFDLRENTVERVVDPHVVPSSLHGHLSSFAWSPDGSKFAAYHFRIEDGQEAFPPEVVLGFWDRNGRWLREYEYSSGVDSDQNCVRYGGEIFEIRGLGLMGGWYEWSPNNVTIAMIESVITLNYQAYSTCTLNPDGTLTVTQVGQFAPRYIHWSSDGDKLFAISMDCSIYVTTEGGRGTTDLVAFDEPCLLRFASWSGDDRYVVLGTENGLWVGEVAGYS